MRILVLWADESSPNLGVRSLAAGTAALLRRVRPDAEFVFQNYGHRAAQLPFGRLRSLVKERITGSLGMMDWLASFDLVVDTRSGDSFSDSYGMHRHAVMCTVAEFAARAGVPLVLGPQTIGPFATARGRTLARRTLRRSALVIARDDESAACARSLGRTVDTVSTDVVFALPAPEPAGAMRHDVILGISGLLWQPNPHVDAVRYRDAVTRLYRELTASGRRVSLLAHVLDSPAADNDVPAVREFAEQVAPDAALIIPHDLNDVRAEFASANLVIASRMHACLGALSVGTPAVPLSYSRKFAPLLRGLGWEHTVSLAHDDPVGAVMRHVDRDGLHAQVADVLARSRDLLDRATNVIAGAWELA